MAIAGIPANRSRLSGLSDTLEPDVVQRQGTQIVLS